MSSQTVTMAITEPIDLFAPVTSDVVLEVRSGKMKNLKGLSILSGIDKSLCPGAVRVTSEGIIGEYVKSGGGVGLRPLFRFRNRDLG